MDGFKSGQLYIIELENVGTQRLREGIVGPQPSVDGAPGADGGGKQVQFIGPINLKLIGQLVPLPLDPPTQGGR